MKSYLHDLRGRYGRYKSDSFDPVGDLLTRYRQYQNTRLVDLAVVALSLGAQPDSVAELNPLALKALQDTNPNFDPDRVGSYSDQEWMGIVNSAKGKYFEYLVVDDLNSGGTVGDLTLPDGYSAQLADSMTQPGWDMRIVDQQGVTAELLQLKATESVGYIQQTLDRYPDISILTTHEVATSLGPHDMVLDSNMTEAEIERAIHEVTGSLNEGYLDQFWDQFHPIAGLLVIVASQGYHVVMSKQSVAGAVEVAKARAARSLLAGGAGAVIKTITGSWIVSVLGAISVGMAFERSQNIDELVEVLKSRNKVLHLRVDHYMNLQGHA